MDISKLKQILPSSQISTSPQDLDTFSRDWTQHFTGKASAIVFPQSTEDVQKLVRWAIETKTALVPSGGRTGLSAAAYATQNEVVVSFQRMNQILGFNKIDENITCQPGVITKDLQNFAVDKGYFFPVDFAASGSSQIGGNIATNAGGIKVLRYGMFRNWVQSLKVVTGQGELLHLNKSLMKNATGYDFRHLFIGSEGTLGFIVEATLGVTSPPHEPQVMLLALNNIQNIFHLFDLFKSELTLNAFEMFEQNAIPHIEKQSPARMPIEKNNPFYVVLEFENDSRSEDKANECLEKAFEQNWVSDGVISQNSQQFNEIWALRENISESISYRQPYKNDISVRISQIPDFLTQLKQIVNNDYPDFEVTCFGHIGDGNLHVNILKPENLTSEEFLKRCHDVDQKMFSMITDLEGSISAEHGVGLVKKPFLHFTRSYEEIALMKQVKNVFDPHNILNPGKIFD